MSRPCVSVYLVCGLLTMVALALGTPAASAATPPAWSPPPLSHAISVRNGRTDQVLSFAAMLDQLAQADVVFLGEQHNDETTHRVELAVYEQLLKRRQGRVVLAMEMFERDVQESLDNYLTGKLSETEFRQQARVWGNYQTAYRPLIERARRAHAPVYASNFPRPLLMRMRMSQQDEAEAFAGLQQQFPLQVPKQLHPNTAAYWRRVDNAIRSHLAMMQQNTGDRQRLYTTQSLWDNTMGETCARALQQHPRHLVLHVNGGFHSAFWDGTVHQLRQRAAGAKIRTVAISPATNPATVQQQGKPVADFAVFVEARATGPDEGHNGVYVQRQLKYKLHVPETTAGNSVPLLIWLPDRGLTADDGLELWRERLGTDVAIVVVEPPYQETQVDNSVGGRWFWTSDFAGDVGTVVGGVERIWAYVLRHYSIDANRVCLAGEGTGATVAAAVTVLTDRMHLRGVALQPRQYAKLKDFPLPMPELAGDDPLPERQLQVMVAAETRSWWQPEIEAYSGAGVPSQIADAAADAWAVERQQEDLIRAALQFGAVARPKTKQRYYLQIPEGVPRARHWARLQALRATAAGIGQVAIVTNPPDDGAATPLQIPITPQQMSQTGVLPKCPGPFGGTTVLVLPEATPADQVDAWAAVEQNDPLTKVSRFYRVRIATPTGERALPTVLDKLRSENRKNVLIVPAVFCADPDWMRQLRRSVQIQEDTMTLQWLPGLGGCKVPFGASDSQTTQHQPVRHQLDIKLDPANHIVEVADQLQLPPRLRKPGIALTLDPAFTITESSIPLQGPTKDAGQQGASPLHKYVLSTVSDDGTVSLRYRGKIEFGLADQKEEYTRGFRETRGVLSREGVFLSGSSHWIPQFNDDLIEFKAAVTAPKDWHVISQGTGNSRVSPGHAQWDSQGLVEQVYLVGGPLVRCQDAAGTVQSLVYLHRADDADGLARKYLEATGQYLEMYRQLIGPYPYGKFALVENFWETGYGMPSFTLLGQQVVRFPFILTSSYPHEILHNWWGNSVFVDYRHGNWCEGLTAYLADHLIQSQHGKGAEYRRNTLQKYRDYVQSARDFPLTEFHSRHNAATEAVGYGKSLMLFHMLRRQIGDEMFGKSLADFYRQFRGQRAGFDDLSAVFSKITNRDWKPFFKQWTTRTGAPQLAVRNVKVAAIGTNEYRVSGVLSQQQQGATFSLQVPMAVATPDGAVTWTVRSTIHDTPFERTLSGIPIGLYIDPEFDLFRVLDPRETPPAIGQLFGEPEVVGLLASAEDASTQARYRQLADAWRSDELQLRVDLDSSVRDLPTDKCVWLFGAENQLARTLFAKSLVRKPGGEWTIRLGQETVPLAGNCIVVVRRHPANMDKAVGWIIVGPAAATAGLARKLPHYGKYSYLAFAGDEPTNFVKGQSSTGNSPLVVDLRRQPTGPMPIPKLPARAPLIDLPPVFSQTDLAADVRWLADPAREGRGLGTAALSDSAHYIAKRMAAAGLQPGGDNGTWFQRFVVEHGPQGRPCETVNVVGVLPGKKSAWAKQSIVVGAHYDHLGLGWPDVRSGNEGIIHPGADDNASGVAVLLALVKNFAASGGASRNLVFVAFSAEECGRLGSKYYVEHPVFPSDGMRAMINFDTVGQLRDKAIRIHGTGTSDQWQHIFRGCGFVTGIACKNVPGNEDASDQMSFIEKGIPAVQIFTGATADYHRPSDTADKIDYPGLVKVAVFTKEAIAYLLERSEPLTPQIAAHGNATSSPSQRRVLFGTVPAFDYQGAGVKVDQLVAGSPAEQAGLKPNDLLEAIDGKKLADLRAFSELLKTLVPGQTVTATVRRGSKQLQIKVTLAAR